MTDKIAASQSKDRSYHRNTLNRDREETWPEASDQQDKSLLYLYRVKSWKNLADEICIFVTTFYEAHSKISDASAKLFKFIDSNNLANNSLPECEIEDLRSLKVHLKTFFDGQKINVTNLKSIVASAQKMRSDCHKSIKEFIAETESMLSSIKKQRAHTLSAVHGHNQSYEKVCVKKSSDNHSIDPWLSEKIIKNEIVKLVEKENEMREKMVISQEEMKKFEENLINTFLSLIAALEAACVNNDFLNRIEAIKAFASSHKGTAGFEYYCRENDLLDQNCFIEKKDPKDYEFLLPDSIKGNEEPIEKEEILERPGDIIKSRFKPCLFVITRNGFLHCFTLKTRSDDLSLAKQNPKMLKYSIYLKAPKVVAQKSNINMNCISIICPQHPKPVFGKKDREYIIKTKSEADANSWLEEISKHLLMFRERPRIEE